MNPEDVIKAGQLAAYRERIRGHFRDSSGGSLMVRLVSSSGRTTQDSVLLDRGMLKAALDGLDLELSRRLEKYGVSEV
jgi:hypothetical protein